MTSLRRFALRSAMRGISVLPRGPAERVFAGVSLLAALGEPSRIAAAVSWAAACQAPRVRTTLGILGHRGRVLVAGWAPVFEQPAELARRVQIEGRAHLDAARGQPVILLGFHLGVPITTWALEACGYSCLTAGNHRWHYADVRRPKPGWAPAPSATSAPRVEAFRFETDDEAQRAVALWHIRRLLGQGRMIRLLADGSGRELFRVPIGNRAVVVRAGWWQLRAASKVVVLPVLAHREGARVVVTVSPPLPNRTGAEAADLTACRDQLAAIVGAFVKQHPDQCPPWRFAAGGH